MMADDRALRVAIAAGEQVAANPELAAAQRAAWARFIRMVWGGPPSMAAPSRCCTVDDRDLLGACRRCGSQEGAR